MGKQPLNILVMTIGTRGDIQPYLQIGKTLKTKHGHRVRIATHPRFQNLVEQDGLMEFHSIGGDPADLMSYRLKSLKSKMEALQEVLTMMSQMFVGFWSACVDLPSVPPRLLSPSKYGIPTYPFVADAIIANPACYAHIHCAERLGIPLHIMFMSSRSPTRELPHPQSIWKCNSGFANFASYQITEYLFSQALGRLLNNFRYDYLGLNPIAAVWVPGQFYRMHIPHSYLWSQAIAPKPREWGEEIDVVGHVLDPADSYAPPKSLLDFLSSGKPPVYIGFGSVASSAIDRTNIILEAVDKAGIRAIIGRGWSNLVVPDCIGAHVYVAEDVPHNWLFPRVHSVVHHGGAGTTAISLRYGRPAVIIPFTGDQFFWGSQVVKLGIGTTIPYSDLTADRLAGAIQHVNSPDIFATATALATKMQREWNGADNAAESFLRKFDQQTWNGMCCILQDRLAVWRERRTGVKLSALAAHILFANEEVEGQDLQPYRQVDWTQYRNLAGLRPGWLAKVTGQLTTTRHSQKPGYGSHKDPDLARSPVGGISVGKRFLAFQRYLLYIVKGIFILIASPQSLLRFGLIRFH